MKQDEEVEPQQPTIEADPPQVTEAVEAVPKVLIFDDLTPEEAFQAVDIRKVAARLTEEGSRDLAYADSGVPFSPPSLGLTDAASKALYEDILQHVRNDYERERQEREQRLAREAVDAAQ
jgi:hypothetical protein